jgi:glycine oxidase
MASSPDALIIGGGVIGCSIAYFLSKASVRVMVVEKEQVGASGATYASAGLLEPLSDAIQPGPMRELAINSFRMFPSFLQEVQEEGDFSVEYRPRGRMRVAFTEEEERELKASLRQSSLLGLELLWLTTDEARKLEPLLSEEVRGARLSPQEHQLSAPRLAEGLKRASLRRGAVFQEHVAVVGLLHQNSRVTGVRAAQGDIPAGHVVLAAGAWTGLLGQELGISLPIEPVRGQVLYLSGLPGPIRFSIESTKGYLVPKGEMVLAGTTLEHAGFDLRVTAGGAFEILQSVRKLVPAVDEASIHHTRAGFRPWATDGLPVLGPVPGMKELTIASGHYRSGILLAPATGQLISQVVTGQAPLIGPTSSDSARSRSSGQAAAEELVPFSPARFLQERARASL